VTSNQRTDPDSVIPLVRLVKDAVADSGLTLREFADVRQIAYSTLRLYADPSLKPLRVGPRPATLRALANALDVPLSRVEAAADASVGRVVREQLTPTAVAVLGVLDDMTPADREVLRQTLADYDS
jgi:hypothetical protein